MNTLKKTVQKAFSASVVFMTAFSVLGVGSLVPTGAFAATYADPEDVEAGDYISFGSSVYYIDEGMNRNYFPHSSVFQNWEPDGFGSVGIHAMNPATVDLDEFFPQAGGINYRAGCQLVKTTVSPRVYAVLPGNKRAHIATEEVARGLYGDNWASLVRDVADVFWGNLTTVDAIDEVVPHDGMVVKAQGSTTQYYVMGGKLHAVDGTDACVRTVSQSVLDTLEIAGDTVTAASIRSNPSQRGASSNNGGDEDETEGPSGDITVSLSAKTPEQSLIPEQATQVPYLAFNVTAGSQDALVRTITFERFGLGDDSNFDKVWLNVNDNPVSNERSVQSDNTVELSPNYTVPAGKTVTFWLMANLDQTTSNPDGTEQDAFRITDIDANGADVSGISSVKGNYMLYSTYSLGTVTISSKGTAQEVEVGDEQEILGEFELNWSSQHENDGLFKTIRFKMEGTADMNDLENLTLYEDNGTVVSETVMVWGDYVTFIIKDSQELLDDGESRRFEIRGDVTGGDDTQTIVFELEDNRDFYFVEKGVNVGSAISTSLETSRRLKTYTIDAGQFTVSLNGSLTPSNEQYAKNTDDVIALVADVDLGQCVTVDGLDIYFSSDSVLNDTTASNSSEATVIDADIERAELWLVSEDGKQKKVGSVTSVSTGGATENDTIGSGEYYYNFDQTFELRDNDMLQLMLDLEEDATTNTYKFTFTNAGGSSNFDDAEYCATGDSVPDGNKTGVVTGNNVEITAANLTITRNDGFSDGETVVVGSKDKLLFKFLIDAGTASDVVVQSLSFDTSDANGYLAANYTKYTNFYLMVDGASQKLSDFKSMGSTGSFTFTSLNLGIEKDEQVTVGLYGSVQTSAATTSSLVFTLDASDSSFEDAEGDDLTNISDISSAALNISSGGVLTVSVDGDTPDATIYAVGSTGAAVTKDIATYKFVAQNDDVYVTDLYIANNTTTGGNAAETTADFLVSKYQLVVDGQVIDEKAATAGKVAFKLSSSNKILVPKDGTKRATVRAVFNKITSADQTGRRIALALYGVEGESKGPGTDLARQTGVTSTAGTRLEVGDVSTDLDLALTGDTMAIYQSVPSVAGVSLGNNPLSLNSGTQDIYQFTVGADAQGDISFSYFALDLTGECRTNQDAAQCVTDVNVYEKLSTNSRKELSVVFTTSTNSSSASEIRVHISSSSPNDIQTVAAGTTKTYIVEATFSGIEAADSISVRMRDHTTAHANPTTLVGAVNAAGSTGPIVWSDNAGVDADPSVAQWFIGRDVPGFDTLLQTFEKSS